MRCEVIAIGTELLLGIIVDSNSAWLGEQLALAGIDSYYQVKVGDNFARIEACIRRGWSAATLSSAAAAWVPPRTISPATSWRKPWTIRFTKILKSAIVWRHSSAAVD